MSLPEPIHGVRNWIHADLALHIIPACQKRRIPFLNRLKSNLAEALINDDVAKVMLAYNMSDRRVLQSDINAEAARASFKAFKDGQIQGAKLMLESKELMLRTRVAGGNYQLAELDKIRLMISQAEATVAQCIEDAEYDDQLMEGRWKEMWGVPQQTKEVDNAIASASTARNTRSSASILKDPQPAKRFRTKGLGYGEESSSMASFQPARTGISGANHSYSDQEKIKTWTTNTALSTWSPYQPGQKISDGNRIDQSAAGGLRNMGISSAHRQQQDPRASNNSKGLSNCKVVIDLLDSDSEDDKLLNLPSIARRSTKREIVVIDDSD